MLIENIMSSHFGIRDQPELCPQQFYLVTEMSTTFIGNQPQLSNLDVHGAFPDGSARSEDFVWCLQVKLWNISGNQPSLVASQNLKAGAVFAGGFCSSAPHLFAVGGAKGSVAVWDVLSNAAVASAFGRKFQGLK